MEEFALIQALKANKRLDDMKAGTPRYLHTITIAGSNYAFSFDVMLNVDTPITDITTFSNLLSGLQLSCTGFYNPSSVVQSHAYLIDTTADIYASYFIKCLSSSGFNTVKFSELVQKTFTDYVQQDVT